jgi:hypothetical protein
MDELRKAALALSDGARVIEAQMIACGDPPARAQLAALQRSVDCIQQGLNRLQTALDAWSEEQEEV